MRLTKTKIFFFLGLAAPILLVFRAIFFPGPAVWGDAPYFYPEGLRELVAQPLAWINRERNLGGLTTILWLYPLMALFGALHKFFGLNSEIIIRLLFYLPAIFLSFVSPVLLARYLGLSKIVQFFASLLYTFNTYFLLLIDGGQIGVALAFGLFPLALLSFRKLFDKPSSINFFFALGVLMILTTADVRFTGIALVSLLVWLAVEWLGSRQNVHLANLRFFIPLLGLWALVSFFWLLPILTIGGVFPDIKATQLQLVSLLNTLFIFQPHWPGNVFGQVTPPPFYFVGIPLLLFGGLIFASGPKRPLARWAFCFLLFAFLAKGEAPPLGEFYGWLVKNLPFGEGLRDSSKFFAPLLLFGGILVGTTAQALQRLKKGLVARVVLLGTIYAYFLFLIHPALVGSSNGVLAGRQFPADFGRIHEKLAATAGFFRTAWFPARHPFAFHTEDKPALDAKDLVRLRPFAVTNVGTYDLFNFMQKENFLDWFDLLGIRYLVFSGDARNPAPNQEEQENWTKLLQLAAEIPGLNKVNWGTSFPIFENPGTLPRIFAVPTVLAVVGPDDIYQKLRQNMSNFSVANQGFVFFEDGKNIPLYLANVDPSSLILVLNQKDETDLTMSFLQQLFVSTQGAVKSDWAQRLSSDYLTWKYELLVNGIDTPEFDYGLGIAFSSQSGEKLEFNLPVPADGEYFVAVRSLAAEGSQLLQLTFAGGSTELVHKRPDLFGWQVLGPIKLTSGAESLTLVNPGGFQVVNTVALIPLKDFEEAKNQARAMMERFNTIEVFDASIGKLTTLLRGVRWTKVNYKQISPVHYRATVPNGTSWIVFTDSFDSDWEPLESLPFYSMINGFYTKDKQELDIFFWGQRVVTLAAKISLTTLLVMTSLFVIGVLRKSHA